MCIYSLYFIKSHTLYLPLSARCCSRFNHSQSIQYGLRPFWSRSGHSNLSHRHFRVIDLFQIPIQFMDCCIHSVECCIGIHDASSCPLHSVVDQPCHSPQDQWHHIIDEGGSFDPVPLVLASGHVLCAERIDYRVIDRVVDIRISRAFVDELVFVVWPSVEFHPLGLVLEQQWNESNASISNAVRSDGILDDAESVEMLDNVPLSLSLRIGMESNANRHGLSWWDITRSRWWIGCWSWSDIKRHHQFGPNFEWESDPEWDPKSHRGIYVPRSCPFDVRSTSNVSEFKSYTYPDSGSQRDQYVNVREPKEKFDGTDPTQKGIRTHNESRTAYLFHGDWTTQCVYGRRVFQLSPGRYAGNVQWRETKRFTSTVCGFRVWFGIQGIDQIMWSLRIAIRISDLGRTRSMRPRVMRLKNVTFFSKTFI